MKVFTTLKTTEPWNTCQSTANVN